MPTLIPGDIVTINDLPALQAESVRSVIERAGATLLYLPPYDLDFNPIEMAFTSFKSLPRA